MFNRCANLICSNQECFQQSINTPKWGIGQPIVYGAHLICQTENESWSLGCITVS